MKQKQIKHTQQLMHESKLTQSTKVSRRRFLSYGAAACALFTLPSAISQVHATMLSTTERKLAFLNLHTDEQVQSTYWAENRYIPEGIQAIENILRDHRTGETHTIDPDLLNILYLLQAKLGTSQAFHVISAYRSAKTNAMLASRSNAVAKRSLHMQGKAIDIRVPEYNLSALRDVAISLNFGGVGYYSKSNFIHLDTGRVRSWGI